MRITLWGTRGSLPSSGPENVRYGGNTASVEVRGENGTVLALDAGTGIRRLGAALSSNVRRVDVLLTHLHMDHIQGLGFFQPLYQPGMEVHIWGPATTDLNLADRLKKYLSPPLFPVRLRDLPSNIELHDFSLERFPIEGIQIGEFNISADLVTHPGPTVGYRIVENGISVTYLPDHEPALGRTALPEERDWTSGSALAAGVDLLIHDAQYSEAEYIEHVGWGHSSMPQALAFAGAAGVKRFVTFHHDPSHSDASLDQLLADARQTCRWPVELVPGTEGATFQLGD